jgi:hypothetical protein
MLQSFKNWWSKPFSNDQSAWGWFLFLGLIMVAIVAWTRILDLIKDVAEEVI